MLSEPNYSLYPGKGEVDKQLPCGSRGISRRPRLFFSNYSHITAPFVLRAWRRLVSGRRGVRVRAGERSWPRATYHYPGSASSRATTPSGRRNPMTTVTTRKPKVRWLILLGLVLGSLLVAGVVAVMVFRMPLPVLSIPSGPDTPTERTVNSSASISTVELVEGTTNTLIVPEPVRQALGIRPAAVAKPPTGTRPLTVPGSTALDPTTVVRVRTRFNAEVMELGQPHEPPETGISVPRDLRPRDTASNSA